MTLFKIQQKSPSPINSGRKLSSSSNSSVTKITHPSKTISSGPLTQKVYSSHHSTSSQLSSNPMPPGHTVAFRDYSSFDFYPQMMPGRSSPLKV